MYNLERRVVSNDNANGSEVQIILGSDTNYWNVIIDIHS